MDIEIYYELSIRELLFQISNKYNLNYYDLLKYCYNNESIDIY